MTQASMAAAGDVFAVDAASPDAALDPAAFDAWLAVKLGARRPVVVAFEGFAGEKRIARSLGLLKRRLAPRALILLGDAHFASVHDALVETAATHPEYRFEAVERTAIGGGRAARMLARLSYAADRTAPQDPASLPAKNERGPAKRSFADASPAMPLAVARTIVERALARWHAPDASEARARRDEMAARFPDQAAVEHYWHDRVGTAFLRFFAWGHDHDFGCGVRRRGTMGGRHIEITSEAMAQGLLPFDLCGREALDIGCWSGGDLLVLAGLGARVTAIEEHSISSEAARHLARLSGCDAEVVGASLYDDRRDWQGKFDLVYCSGVLYHVTDPLLFLRLCFAYLKPGGQLVIETKAEGAAGSLCGYSGTLEKGWNWYAPTREALGRLLVDAGFSAERIALHWRPIGRLLAGAVKDGLAEMPDPTGFSRPGSWLAGRV